MPLSRIQKENIVTKAADVLGKSRFTIFADFTGMSVAKSRAFRQMVRKEGGGFQVLKKTLARLALTKHGLPTDLLDNYGGTLAVAVHPNEDNNLAKVFFQAAKEFPELKVIGGLYEKRSISRADVMELAKLPTKNEMLARLCGTLIAPLSGFARVLNGPIVGFTTIINKLAIK